MSNPKQASSARSHEPFQSLMASTEPLAQSAASLLRSAACAQLEFTALAGRRTRAYLDIPQTLAGCQNAQDVVRAQAQFWQNMLQDYAAYTTRVMTTLQECTEDLQREGTGTSRAKDGRETRDVLAFPNVFGFPAWVLPAVPGRETERAA